MSVKKINLIVDLKKQLDRQTLGLKNRKQKKLIVSAFPLDEHDNSNQLEDSGIQISESEPVESRETKISAENTSFLNRLIHNFIGNFGNVERQIFKKSIYSLLPMLKMSGMTTSLLSFLMQINPASADPMSNFTFVAGSTNCSSGILADQVFGKEAVNCQQFELFYNGSKILTGYIQRHLGFWDTDHTQINPPGLGKQGFSYMPPGICSKLFNMCYSYPHVVARLTSMLNSPTATNLFLGYDYPKNPYCGEYCSPMDPALSCNDFLGTNCLGVISLRGLTDEGCSSYRGVAKQSDPSSVFWQCFARASEEIKNVNQEQYSKKLKHSLFSGTVAVLLILTGIKYKNYRDAAEQKLQQERQRQLDIVNMHMSQLTLTRFSMNGRCGDNSKPPYLDEELTREILAFSCHNKVLKEQVLAENNRINVKRDLRDLHLIQYTTAKQLMSLKFKNNKIGRLENYITFNILSFLYSDIQKPERSLKLNKLVIDEVAKFSKLDQRLFRPTSF